ncbi:MAG: ABC transporter ATP-binding protein [Patescibacteria group bacterium]
MKEIYQASRPFMRALGVALAVTLLLQVIGTVTPYFMGLTVDAVIGKNVSGAFKLLAVFILLNSASVLIALWKDRFELRNFDFAMPRHYNDMSVGKVMELSMSQVSEGNSQFRLGVMQRGQMAAQDLLRTLIYQAAPQVLSVTVLSVAMIYTNRDLGLVLLASIIGYGYLVVRESLDKRTALDELETARQRDSKRRAEVMRNARLVMANAQEVRMRTDLDKREGERSQLSIKIFSSLSTRAHMRMLVLQGLRFGIMSISIWQVARGDYTPGFVVIFWSWVGNALGGVTMLGSLQRQILDQVTGLRKYLRMMRVEPDVREVSNPVRPDNFDGQIVFKNVSYAYRSRMRRGAVEDDEDNENEEVALLEEKREPALRNINLTVTPGERVAFVGESGAGKSSIVAALLRAFDPDEGEILIDGVDLRLLDLKQFRSAVGIVEQDVTLFDTSLRENLLFGAGSREVSDAELTEACRVARVDRFMHKLERGYDTLIGERGVKLSGGERQRVGIARALLKDPAVLIFDEATSNLDAENEHFIHAALEEASKGRTTIIIAHRFSTISHVDRIYVVDDGCIVAVGSHDELLKNSTHYRRLVAYQGIVS